MYPKNKSIHSGTSNAMEIPSVKKSIYTNEGFPDFSFKDFKRRESAFEEIVTFADLNSRINALETRKNSPGSRLPKTSSEINEYIYSGQKGKQIIQSEQINKIERSGKRNYRKNSEIKNYTGDRWNSKPGQRKSFSRHLTFGSRKVPDFPDEDSQKLTDNQITNDEKPDTLKKEDVTQKKKPDLIKETFTDPIEEQQSSYEYNQKIKHNQTKTKSQRRKLKNIKPFKKKHQESWREINSKNYYSSPSNNKRQVAEKFVHKEPVNNIYTQKIEHYKLPEQIKRGSMHTESHRGSLYQPKRMTGGRFSNLSGGQQVMASRDFENRNSKRDSINQVIGSKMEKIQNVPEVNPIVEINENQENFEKLSDDTLKSHRIIDTEPINRKEPIIERQNTEKRNFQSRSASPNKLISIGKKKTQENQNNNEKGGERKTRGANRNEIKSLKEKKRSLYTSNLRVLNPARKKKKPSSLNVYSKRSDRLMANIKKELAKDYKSQYKSSERPKISNKSKIKESL